MPDNSKLLPMACTKCGMTCDMREFHPFAACLMFKACRDSDTVRANLAAVQDYARQAPAPVEVSRLAGDFVEHSHPEFGQGYFCTPDVFAKIESVASTPVCEVPAGQLDGLEAYLRYLLTAVEVQVWSNDKFVKEHTANLRRWADALAASPSPAASMEVQGLTTEEAVATVIGTNHLDGRVRWNKPGSLGLPLGTSLYGRPSPAVRYLTADEATEIATQHFPRWREDIQERFVVLLCDAFERALAAKNGWRLGEGRG